MAAQFYDSVLKIQYEKKSTTQGVQIGISSSIIDVEALMDAWCKAIDQKCILAESISPSLAMSFQTRRGYTYREFYSLFNGTISESEYPQHPVFRFINASQGGILTEQQRAYFATKYQFTKESYEQSLIESGFEEMLTYYRSQSQRAKIVSLSEFESHCYILAKTNSGKSALMRHLYFRINELLPDATHIVLDPHGSLVQQIYNTSQTTRDNTIYLDPYFKKGWTYTINVFDVPDHEDRTISFASENIIGVIHEVLRSSGVSDIQESILQDCINFIYTREHPKFEDLLNLLDLEPNILASASTFSTTFSSKEFKSSTTRNALRTRFRKILNNKTLSTMLRGEGTIKLNEEINNGKNILFNLGGLPEELSQPAYAKLLLGYIRNILKQRENLVDPRPLFLWIDECQLFVTNTYAKFISQMRKFGARVILSNQFIEQIEDDQSRIAIQKQMGIKIGYARNAKDLSVIDIPSSYVKTDGQSSTLKLQRFEFLVQTDKGVESFKAPSFLLNGEYDLSHESKQRIDQSILDKYYIKKEEAQRSSPPFSDDLYIDE